MEDVNIYICTEFRGTLAKGSGKWNVILEVIRDGEPKTLMWQEALKDCTKNRLDLTALDAALSHMTKRSRIKIYTDSEYILTAITQGWLDRWVASGFKIKKKAIKNEQLWRSIYTNLTKHDITILQAASTSYTSYQITQMKRLGGQNEH